MAEIDIDEIIRNLRQGKLIDAKTIALKQAQESNDLKEKCIILRVYTTPQSTDAEKLIKRDLEIQNCVDNVSGDGVKNGVNYEIKVSVHDAKCKINIRQIRPHHKIDFYIIVALNVFSGESGEAYIFKVPSTVIYDLVLGYGGYTHGTVSKNGEISVDSISDVSKFHEYSLSVNPNAKVGTKSKELWDKLLKYRVNYDKNSF